MCLIAIAYNCHPDYPLVVTANRDEFYHRPTANAAFWDDHPELLAGKDLEQGGTWLGVTRDGRFAAITNYREDVLTPATRSRGELTLNFLIGQQSAMEYAETIHPRGDLYNGFNLLLFDGNELISCSNRYQQIQLLNAGLYGLSNHLLETPWPKVQSAKANLRDILNHPEIENQQLLDALIRREPYPDHHLPNTGIEHRWEKSLSAPFVLMDGYGTRCSTAVTINQKGRLHFTEQSFDEQGECAETADFILQLNR